MCTTCDFEPLDERWLADVAELVEDPHVQRFTRIPEPPPQDFARSWIVANRASQRVAERCGYQHEGDMRSIHLKDGRRIDAGLWSRLPTDPPSR